MFKDKYKAYIFTIIATVFCIFTSGINYIVFDTNKKVLGIVFVLAICAGIINVFCYTTDKYNENKK